MSPADAAPRWVEAGGRLVRLAATPGRGPLIVLLHELGGAVESWSPVLRGLAGRATLAIDLPGHGLSEKPRGAVTLDGIARQVEAVLDLVAPGAPVVCVGSAAGGAVAIALAARLGPRAAGLVGLAPATGVPPERRARAADMADRVARDGIRGLFDSDIAPNAWPEALIPRGPEFERFRALQLGTDPVGWAALARMLLTVDLLPVLAGLACPVLLLAGNHDRMRSPATIAQLAAQVPNAGFAALDSGHFMALQTPGLVAARIRAFVEGLDGGAGETS